MNASICGIDWSVVILRVRLKRYERVKRTYFMISTMIRITLISSETPAPIANPSTI